MLRLFIVYVDISFKLLITNNQFYALGFIPVAAVNAKDDLRLKITCWTSQGSVVTF